MAWGGDMGIGRTGSRGGECSVLESVDQLINRPKPLESQVSSWVWPFYTLRTEARPCPYVVCGLHASGHLLKSGHIV